MVTVVFSTISRLVSDAVFLWLSFLNHSWFLRLSLLWLNYNSFVLYSSRVLFVMVSWLVVTSVMSGGRISVVHWSRHIGVVNWSMLMIAEVRVMIDDWNMD